MYVKGLTINIFIHFFHFLIDIAGESAIDDEER